MAYLHQLIQLVNQIGESKAAIIILEWGSKQQACNVKPKNKLQCVNLHWPRYIRIDIHQSIRECWIFSTVEELRVL